MRIDGARPFSFGGAGVFLSFVTNTPEVQEHRQESGPSDISRLNAVCSGPGMARKFFLARQSRAQYKK